MVKISVQYLEKVHPLAKKISNDVLNPVICKFSIMTHQALPTLSRSYPERDRKKQKKKAEGCKRSVAVSPFPRLLRMRGGQIQRGANGFHALFPCTLNITIRKSIVLHLYRCVRDSFLEVIILSKNRLHWPSCSFWICPCRFESVEHLNFLTHENFYYKFKHSFRI